MNLSDGITTDKGWIRYRELKVGERVMKGDEWTAHVNLPLDSSMGWNPTEDTISHAACSLRYRRPITPDALDEAEAMLGGVGGLQKVSRKQQPLYSGCLKYFPDALKAVAHCSQVGNDQHNPGTPLKWDRSKSGDELDAMLRHAAEAGTVDNDGVLHSTKVAWRALANLQKELEASAGKKELEELEA